MKKIIFTLLLFLPLIIQAQSNSLLNADFWKANPDLKSIQEEISKGNNPSEANRGNFDATCLAILNNANNESIKFLLEQDGNGIDKRTHDGRTYLHWATIQNNVEIVTHLINNGWTADLTDDKGANPLVFGASNAQVHKNILKAFFDAGIDPHQKYKSGANILLITIPNDPTFEATEYLISKGLSLSDKDAEGNNAFDYAARSGNVEHLKNILQKGIQPTESALIIASEGGRRSTSPIEVYKYLIEDLKIDPSATSKTGKTALHNIVTKSKQENIIAYFLGKGVDINHADKEGNTVFMEAASTKEIEAFQLLLPYVKDINASNKKGESALVQAVKSSSPEIVQLLIEKGADINVQSKDGNLAYYLIQSYEGKGPRNNVEDFSKKKSILKENGFDFAAAQDDGNTLFHFAVAKNDLGLLKKLEEFNIDINAKNEEGMTALHRAALFARETKVLEYLIEKGANKDILTDFEESAYDLASENEYLIANNVSINFLK